LIGVSTLARVRVCFYDPHAHVFVHFTANCLGINLKDRTFLHAKVQNVCVCVCVCVSLSLSLSLSLYVCVCVFEYVGRLSGSGVRCAAEAQIWEIFFTKNGAIVYLRTERYVCWKGLISGRYLAHLRITKPLCARPCIHAYTEAVLLDRVLYLPTFRRLTC
jgi:hypothetical protein